MSRPLASISDGLILSGIAKPSEQAIAYISDGLILLWNRVEPKYIYSVDVLMFDTFTTIIDEFTFVDAEVDTDDDIQVEMQL